MNTQTVILLNREHDITAFASNDQSRYVLQSVHYNEAAQCLEAVNGRCLIRVPVQKSEDYPTLSGEFAPAKDMIIPIAPFKKAMASIPKSAVEVLCNVAMSSVNGEKVRLTTNDMDNENSVVAKRIDGIYPNCEQVIPTATPTFSISISAHELQNIANYFAKHGVGQCAVNFQFTADCEAVRFSGTTTSGKKVVGVVMPMRMS
jgi:DNA polymerase III sliding clamp (beta) subunit (PCNA family)